jgi:hypothetical protein
MPVGTRARGALEKFNVGVLGRKQREAEHGLEPGVRGQVRLSVSRLMLARKPLEEGEQPLLLSTDGDGGNPYSG